jgi:LPS export ABC transporter protein LptC
VLLLTSCSGDTTKIEELYQATDVAQEVVSNVKITYSDSARVWLMVQSPKLIRQEIDDKEIEIFPEGLEVEFYQDGYRPSTWLQAEKGTRYSDEKRIVLEGHVQLFNDKMDKLETAELIWDEENQQIMTEKFVRITQPEKGDTTFGFGFISDQHFKRFEIKRRFSGKIEESMLKDLTE